MCYHNSQNANAAKVVKRFKAEIKKPDLFKPVYHASGFSHPDWPVITNVEKGQIDMFKWGLVPKWIKSKDEALKIRIQTLNCRFETAFEKPSFRSSISKNRCLVLSTGFFEWQDFNKQKYPHFITTSTHEEGIFAMAGIWESWVDKSTGEILDTFSILTTVANPLMAKIHNVKKRMPVILPPDAEVAWLEEKISKEEILGFNKQFSEEQMKAHTISKLITSRTDNPNVPEVMLPHIYVELQPPSTLF